MTPSENIPENDGCTYEEQELEVVVNDYLEETFDGVPDVLELDPSTLASGIVRAISDRQDAINTYDLGVNGDEVHRLAQLMYESLSVGPFPHHYHESSLYHTMARAVIQDRIERHKKSRA